MLTISTDIQRISRQKLQDSPKNYRQGRFDGSSAILATAIPTAIRASKISLTPVSARELS
jgi:hypothetical protein